MTGNSKKIFKLRSKQKRKKKNISRYKKRAKKHILLLTIPFVAYAFINLDNAFKQFGSVSKFLSILASILVGCILIYLVVMFYLIKQEQREIKIIRSKIYKLSKLSDE